MTIPAFIPAMDDRIVTIECFNRGDDYGEMFFRALDRGWHVGAIGVSDHHEEDWGSPTFPRAGVLAPTLALPDLLAALQARRVFATRSPTLMLLVAGQDAHMGARLRLDQHEPLTIGVWCDDPTAGQAQTRIELWSNGPTLVDAYETRGLQQVSWQTTLRPQENAKHWFAVRVLHNGATLAYASPIWACWAEWRV